jgi:hypothetical protein
MESVDKEVKKRYCHLNNTESDITSFCDAFQNATKWPMSPLATTMICSDGEFVHKPSGTTLPIHKFILRQSIEVLRSIGVQWTVVEEDDVSSFLFLLENLDVSARAVTNMWSLLHGVNIFESSETEGYKWYKKQSHSFSSFVYIMMPVLEVFGAIKILVNDAARGKWYLDLFGATLVEALEKKLFYYACHYAPEFDEDGVTALQHLIKLIKSSDPNLSNTVTLDMLRAVYGIASVVFLSESVPRRTVWEWFGIDDIDKMLHVVSTPYQLILSRVKEITVSGRPETSKLFKVFEDNTSLMHEALSQYALSYLKRLELASSPDKLDLDEATTQPTSSKFPGPPNFKITIEGDNEGHVYHVHDSVLVQWRFFRRLVESGMSECQSRIMVLPKCFRPNVLRCIIAVLYGVDLKASKYGSDFCSSLSMLDFLFVFDNAIEFSLIPNSAEEAIGSDPVSQRFDVFLKYCYLRVSYSSSPAGNLFALKPKSRLASFYAISMKTL